MQSASSLLRRVFDLAFNQGDLDIMDDLVAHDGVTHAMNWGMSSSGSGLKQLIAAYRTAFPDLCCAIQDEITKDDRLAALWTMRGTHTGPFLGNPPTGRSILAQGIIFARIENGRITEDWTLVDQMGILQQLGIVPPPNRK